MLLIDTVQGRIIDDAEVKKALATAKPYKQWIEQSRYFLADMPKVEGGLKLNASLLDTQQAFGYTQEDIKFVLQPMVQNGEEGSGSMGKMQHCLYCLPDQKSCITTSNSYSHR